MVAHLRIDVTRHNFSEGANVHVSENHIIGFQRNIADIGILTRFNVSKN